MNRVFIKKHIACFSIALFLAIIFVITTIKPHFLFTRNGSLRDFGIGFKNKTIIPMWLVVIIVAILSYYAVLHIIVAPKLNRLIL